MGIKRIVALLGDLPSGMAIIGEFQNTNELVSFICTHTGEHFQIEVSDYSEFHSQANSTREDILNFKQKIHAVVSSVIM
jgi:methylenetetrahydrofolate reductase (NADPH)